MSKFVGLILVLLLAASTAICAPFSDRLLICDFEKESDIARFRLRSPTPAARFFLTRGRSSKGSTAASIVVPKWEQLTDQWPAIILTAEKGLPTDWSMYDSLACHVYNACPTEIDIGFYVRDAAGKYGSGRFLLLPGKSTTVRLAFDSLPADFDLKRVAELHVLGMSPQEGVSVVIDDIRVECDVRPRLARIWQSITKLRHESADCASEVAPLLEALSSAHARVAKRASDAADLTQLRALRPEGIALEQRLTRETVRLVPEAKMRSAARKIDPNASYGCGFASSMEKVFPKDVAFTCSAAREMSVELAANEVESFQVLIYAFGKDITDAKVSVSPLVAPGGKRGPVAQVSPVGFVETKKPPYPVNYIGWHPDPILDFLQSFDVKKNEVQPVWVRIKAPAGTAPGDYSGTITVTASNAPATRLALNVRVWGFEVPKETHLRTAMSLYDHFLKNAYGETTEAMRAKYEDFVLAYRINPDNIYRTSPPPLESVLRWNKQGLNAFALVCIHKPAGLKAGNPFPADQKAAILAKLDAVVPKLKANGLYSKAYVYGFDEIGPESYAAMKDVFGAIKAKYPDLMIMTTGRDHTYGEESGIDAVDAWCPLTPHYDLERVRKARERGKQVWWYVCIEPKTPFANWLIEYDAIDARMLMGLQTAKYEPDGFLYYAMMRWPLTKKPITDGPYTDWPPASFLDCNGDGSIICAGPDGPLATIRLENIRDGIEDYEYFWLLKQEANRLRKLSSAPARDALQKAERALTIGTDLVSRLSSFNKSPDRLLAKRREVAEAILACRKVR